MRELLRLESGGAMLRVQNFFSAFMGPAGRNGRAFLFLHRYRVERTG
jgi:hypothetical protein